MYSEESLRADFSSALRWLFCWLADFLEITLTDKLGCVISGLSYLAYPLNFPFGIICFKLYVAVLFGGTRCEWRFTRSSSLSSLATSLPLPNESVDDLPDPSSLAVLPYSISSWLTPFWSIWPCNRSNCNFTLTFEGVAWAI